MFVPPVQYGDALTLRIEINRVQPAIWRRVRVPAHYSVGNLHTIIQTVFGWTDSHLHGFMINGLEFGVADVNDPRLFVDERGAPLGAVLKRDMKCQYTYDFGDDWEHEVEMEGVTANGLEHATCLAGARACPPEDCGGAPGYENLLAALASSKHPEHRERREWLGKRFDPENFNLSAVNKKLTALSRAVEKFSARNRNA